MIDILQKNQQKLKIIQWKGLSIMNSYNVSEIWEQLLQRLKNSVSETVYNTIISPAVPLSATDTVFIIGVNNNFLKKWLEENYKPIIENLLAEITGKEFSLQIENLDFTAAPVQKQAPKEEPPAPAPQPAQVAPQKADRQPIPAFWWMVTRSDTARARYSFS